MRSGRRLRGLGRTASRWKGTASSEAACCAYKTTHRIFITPTRPTQRCDHNPVRAQTRTWSTAPGSTATGAFDIPICVRSGRQLSVNVRCPLRLCENACEAAPEIPSYENLLTERIGYSRLLARLKAHQICHWGKNQTAEINEGRGVRASID
jgi:hypothetical protein